MDDKLLQPIWVLFVAFALATCNLQIVIAESSVSPLDEEGRVIDFVRDVAPILRDRCLECHGPEDAKNDFRVDEAEMVMDYLEPEDWESSTMYVDYLTIDDEDMLMPPKSHGGPLSAAELAVMRVWIDEGANWPDGFTFVSTAATEQEEKPEAALPESLPQRFWSFQGFLHPATVHFPIALLLFGAFFVVLGWKWPSVGTQIPLACLVFGAISAIVASAMGWSFAAERGYGGWTKVDFDSEFFWHRWGGVIVSVVASLLAIVAIRAVRRQSETLTKVWKVGLLVLAGMVGAVGHQGGELNYGKDFYPKAFRILLASDEKPEADTGKEKSQKAPQPQVATE